MAQAEHTTTNIYGKVPTEISTLSTDSGGYISIPAEMASQLAPYFCSTLETDTTKENEQVKKELKSTKEEFQQFLIKFAKQSFELDECREEIKARKEDAEKSKHALPSFYALIDPRMFTDSKGYSPSQKWVYSLWDTLYTHSMNTSKEGDYYIDNTTSVAIIYKLLHESNRLAYNFTGTYNDFSFAWNANVVGRITNTSHAQKLSCEGDTIKAEYNKSHWKNMSIGNLEQSKEFEGKHAHIYAKAKTIITNLLPDLRTIPTF